MLNKIIQLLKEFSKRKNKEINRENNIPEELNQLEHSLKDLTEDNVSDRDVDNGIMDFCVTPKQLIILKKLSRERTISCHIKQRVEIILALFKNLNNTQVATQLNITRQTVGVWRKRWSKQKDYLDYIEKNETSQLKSTIIEILQDAYRSGKIHTFTMIQQAMIIYLSLQRPELFDLPVSNWTATLLAKKAIELEIVERISASQVNRYLNQMDIKIHQYEGWLNSADKINNPEEFSKRSEAVCLIYQKSMEMKEDGIHVISTDEKTGIQALEHKYASKPVQAGQVEKCEQEYIRHGTQALIASRDVNTGRILAPMVNDTRNEKDFTEHISNVIATAPDDEYIFIMDQLNTHKSESLVRLIAKACRIDDDLGKKGESGILKSMKSRQSFLEDESHRIRIVYTPKHCSWLNQIEIWFSILKRMLLNKRSSFKSIKELKGKIMKFIDYYNQYLAKPFKWTHTGTLLQK